MDPKEREGKLEAWLDDALAHYNDAEPRTGLEGRVLANVRAEERRPPRRSWMVWMPAVTAVVAVIVVMVAIRPHQEAIQETTSAPKSEQEQVQKDAATAALHAQVIEQKETASTVQRKAKASAGKASREANEQKTERAQDILPAAPASAARTTVAGGLGRPPGLPPPPLKSAPMQGTPRSLSGEASAQVQSMEAPVAAPSADKGRSLTSLPESAVVPPSGEQQGFAIGGLMPMSVMKSGNMRLDQAADVFPAPRGLTEQEQLMLAVMRRGVSLAVPRAPLPPGDELLPAVQIDEIRIKPLQVSEK